MTNQEKVELALVKISELTDLLDGNEYQTYIFSKLLTVQYELLRQRTHWCTPIDNPV